MRAILHRSSVASSVSGLNITQKLCAQLCELHCMLYEKKTAAADITIVLRKFRSENQIGPHVCRDSCCNGLNLTQKSSCVSGAESAHK